MPIMEDDIRENGFLSEDEAKRFAEEEEDGALNAIPPTDIIAFTEQRSCADIYRMYKKGQLEIQPDFQRGDVWSLRSQTLFIDSLIKQLPIPSLCISLDVSSQRRLVIDGLQRIRTIIKFLDDTPGKEYGLSQTKAVDSRLSGKKVSQIRKDNPELCEILENVTIPITILRCDYSKKAHMQYLYQIFYRLNTGGNKLYNQEIRNCIFQGTFNTFLKSYVRDEQWLRLYGVTEKDINKARFRYEEQLLRFFAFYNNLDNYNGSLASFLNDYMEDNMNSSDAAIEEFTNLISRTIQVASKIVDLSTSINIREAVFVGIAKNLDRLETQEGRLIDVKYRRMLMEKEFSTEEMQEGLSSKDKVKNRINCAIRVLGE